MRLLFLFFFLSVPALAENSIQLLSVWRDPAPEETSNSRLLENPLARYLFFRGAAGGQTLDVRLEVGKTDGTDWKPTSASRLTIKVSKEAVDAFVEGYNKAVERSDEIRRMNYERQERILRQYGYR